MRVYLDLVMLLNFLVDSLLLLGTNRLSGFPTRWGRVVGAAALGGVYGGACLLPGFQFLGNTFWRLVSLAGMGSIAFGWSPGALKRSGLFLVLTMALGGAAMSVGTNSFPGLLGAGAGLWGLCRAAFSGETGEGKYVPLCITQDDAKVELRALRDTGNTLRDPVTGEQVLIISPEAAFALTGLTRQQLENPMETMAARPIPGLRLIPYHGVGASGFLLAKRFDRVRVGSGIRQAVVAFAPEGLGGEGSIQALTGGVI